jgi:MFS family permease
LSSDVARLLLLNTFVFVLGLGLLPLLRVAQSWSEVRSRWPLSYMVGLAVLGITGATLELVHVPLGLVEVAVLSVAATVGGGLRLYDLRSRRGGNQHPSTASGNRMERLSLAAGLIALSLALALAVAPDRTDAANALTQMLGGVLVIVAPYLLGSLADHLGLRSAFTVEPVLIALCALLLVGGLKTAGRGSEEPALALQRQG